MSTLTNPTTVVQAELTPPGSVRSNGQAVDDLLGAMNSQCSASTSNECSSTFSGRTRSRWRSLVKYWVDPRRDFHRYFVLGLICMFIPGPYYHDSLLSTFKGPVSDAMNLSNEQFSMLFAVSSLTGICSGPLGPIIAQFGRTRMALAAGFACAMGSLFTVLGLYWNRLWVMLIARFVFWLGLYVLLVVQTLLVYSLFSGKQMSVAYSLLITFCRLGGLFGYFTSGPLLRSLGLMGSMKLSVVCVFCAFIAILIFAQFFRGTATSRAVRPLLGGQRPVKEFSLRLIKEVPHSVWAVICAVGVLYATIFPFEVIADDLLQTDFGFSANNAGFLLTTIPAFSLLTPIFSPFMGTWPTQKLCCSSAGFLILVIGQVLLALDRTWSPYGSFICMGVGFSMTVCSLWTVIPTLVCDAVPRENAKNVEGLVTGLGYAALAICQFISNTVVGMIRDRASTKYVCMWFAILSALGIILSILGAIWHAPVIVHEPTDGAQLEEIDGSITVHCCSRGPGVQQLELGTEVQENYYMPDRQ